MAKNQTPTVDRTALVVAGIGFLGAMAAAVIGKLHLPSSEAPKAVTHPAMSAPVPEAVFESHNLYPVALGSIRRGMSFSAVKVYYGDQFKGDEQKATATINVGPFSEASFDFRESKSGPVLETITLGYRGDGKKQEAAVNRDAIDKLGSRFKDDPLDADTHVWESGREKLLVAPDKCVIESVKN